jgi:hypothetical protein
MTSVRVELPAKYRERAAEARAKAQLAPDERSRKAFLNDAELWERMAAYEETKDDRSSDTA